MAGPGSARLGLAAPPSLTAAAATSGCWAAPTALGWPAWPFPGRSPGCPASAASSSPASSPDSSSSSSSGGGGGGFSPSPVPGAARKGPGPRGRPGLGAGQRRSASQREKLRMRRLAHALRALRRYLPASVAPPGQSLTKVETLRLAVRYIAHLADLLTHGAPPDHHGQQRDEEAAAAAAAGWRVLPLGRARSGPRDGLGPRRTPPCGCPQRPPPAPEAWPSAPLQPPLALPEFWDPDPRRSPGPEAPTPFAAWSWADADAATAAGSDGCSAWTGSPGEGQTPAVPAWAHEEPRTPLPPPPLWPAELPATREDLLPPAQSLPAELLAFLD